MEAFIHPLPPSGYSPLSQGESRLQTENVNRKTENVKRSTFTASANRPTSQWKLLPSEGTEAHPVLLLKTLFAP